MNLNRLLCVIGQALFVYGVLIAAVVFVELQVLNATYDLNGFSIRVFGYPWGTEQVTAGSCLLKASNWTPDDPNCVFLNYDELLYISILVSFVGFMMWKYYGPLVRLNVGGL